MPKFEPKEISNWEHNNSLVAKRIMDVGSDADINLDYDERIDNQPVYVGYGARGLADGTDGWLIYQLTYDLSNRVTRVEKAIGVWNNRGSYF